ncbi:hypothetical protein BJ165DRAFT_1533890 [Panaeolus papilionaceus]|nr:hypothetical protein BJ165DRAFT_1533890 [Panaeolus papilionaceus]
MSTIPDFATKLRKIKVLGAVSVEKVSTVGPLNRDGDFVVFVLLGPTGSGKSSFIEAVASNTSLGLSSDMLEGFTQSVSTYRIINVVKRVQGRDSPIYLVDVPGFADNNISVMSIVSMLKDMIQTSPDLYHFRILYHTPINNPRLPGSQRRVLRTFEALTGPNSAQHITIISTMWDLIWGESARRRAEGNFTQLRKEIWKDYIAGGANMVKFHNTPESALAILDDAYNRRGQSFPSFSITKSIHLPLRQTPFASHIYDDLQTRIGNLQMQQINIQSELQMAREQSDEELGAILIGQLKEMEILSAKFREELRDFGSPPDPAITLEPVPPNDGLAIPTPAPLPTSEPVTSAPGPVMLATQAEVVTPVVELIASTSEAKSLDGGIFAKATKRVKGWQNKVSKNRASD